LSGQASFGGASRRTPSQAGPKQLREPHIKLNLPDKG
jgi:hypothetical protein